MSLSVSLITVIVCSSCVSNNSEVSSSVLLDKSITADLSELGANIDIIPIDSVSSIIDATYAKIYDDRLFIYSATYRNILYSTQSGYHLFDRLGRGPSEYIDIGAFTYMPDTDELVIFERSKRRLLFYLLSDNSQTRQLNTNWYINAMEYCGNNTLLCVKEASAHEPAAIIMLNMVDSSQEVLVPLREDQADLMEDFVLSRAVDNGVIFGVSGETMNFYSYDGVIAQTSAIGFRPSSLGKRYWQGQWNEQKEMMLVKALSRGDPVPLCPSHISSKDGNMVFWFITEQGKNARKLPKRKCCILKNREASVYSAITCNDLRIDNLQPIASNDNKYYTLLCADEISPDVSSAIGKLAASYIDDGYINLILTYEIL